MGFRVLLVGFTLKFGQPLFLLLLGAFFPKSSAPFSSFLFTESSVALPLALLATGALQELLWHCLAGRGGGLSLLNAVSVAQGEARGCKEGFRV